MSLYVSNYTYQTNHVSEMAGGLEFFVRYLEIYLPYVTLSSIGLIVGSLGNGLIIASILVSKSLRRNATCIMCLNLAISDLVINIFSDLLTVVEALLGEAYFNNNKYLCEFIAAACIIACVSSLITMTFLAINRYICIFYHSAYNKIFSISKTNLFCLLAWFIGLLVELPNFTSIGRLVYDKKTLQCIFDRLMVVYTTGFCIIAIFIPCAGIAFCYARIFWHSYSSKKKSLQKFKASINNKEKLNKEALKIAKSLFASFFLFAACWIPFAIIFLVDFEDNLPMSAHAFANLAAHLNSALNPIFYWIFNPVIREGYKNLICKITCNKLCKKKSSETTSKNLRSKI